MQLISPIFLSAGSDLSAVRLLHFPSAQDRSHCHEAYELITTVDKKQRPVTLAEKLLRVFARDHCAEADDHRGVDSVQRVRRMHEIKKPLEDQGGDQRDHKYRSEEHTSELQSLAY